MHAKSCTIKYVMDSTAQLATILKSGGVAVIRTDTLYGIVARADNEQAVDRVFRAKHRDPKKSCIILIANKSQAYGDMDSVTYDNSVPTSILIESPQAPHWLLRANSQLAYRIPNNTFLVELLEKTGPLIAPSANIEGETPASTIEEAKAFFGSTVDIYVDGGKVPSDTPPSRLIRYTNGLIERLR